MVAGSIARASGRAAIIRLDSIFELKGLITVGAQEGSERVRYCGIDCDMPA